MSETPRIESPVACIYCQDLLGTATRDAHVLSRSLGGRLFSKRTECSQCNESFGRLENELTEDLRSIAAKVGAITADGKKISAQVDIPEGRKGRVWRGAIEPKLPPPTFKEEDGKRIRYQKLPRDDGERARVIARQLFDDGKPLDDFDAGRYELVFDPWSNKTTRVDLGEFTLRVGRREHRRVFAKMAISLLGCFNEDAARSSYLEPAVKFASQDKGDFEYQVEGSSPGSGLLAEESLPRFVHAIETWTCDGKLLTKIRFFSRICFTAVLAKSWPRSPISAAYAVDPLGLEKPVRASAQADGLRLGIVHPRSADDVVADLEKWIEAELHEIARASKDDPSTHAPDPAILKPLIRKRLAKLWKKHGNKPRGGRSRKPSPESCGD